MLVVVFRGVVEWGSEFITFGIGCGTKGIGTIRRCEDSEHRRKMLLGSPMINDSHTAHDKGRNQC